MSKRRPIPYHASAAVEDAEALLRRACRLLDDGLDDDPPVRYAAIMAQAGRLVSEAWLCLKEVERPTGGQQ